MVARLDPEEAMESMVLAGLNPLEPYPNTVNLPWKSECIFCGNTVAPTVNHIRSGRGGCNFCAYRRKSGEGHYMWKGNRVGYRTMHQRIRNKRGFASTYLCVDCSEDADEWSYNGKAEYERFDNTGQAANLLYSTDTDDYEPRCKSCHKKFDALLNKARGRLSHA